MKERILKMYYQLEDLRFADDDEAREFYYALGRMAAYGLNGDGEGISIVNAVIDNRKEIICAYYPIVPRTTGNYQQNKKFYDLDAAFTPFTTNEYGHVFVMGAVPRPATETDKFRYSFHS